MKERQKSMPRSSLIASITEDEMRTAISDYEFTCQTIVTMSNIVSFNLGGTTAQGKKLHTSPANMISPNTSVTPDLAIEIQANHGDDSYHAVEW